MLEMHFADQLRKNGKRPLQEEMDSMKANKVWNIDQSFERSKAIGNKWILKY